MHINTEQLRSCLTGCSVIEEEDGYLLLNRFLPEQIAIYPPEHRWVPRSKNQSTITLDFHTDSTKLVLHLRKVGSWSTIDDYFADFEVYEDGVFTRVMTVTDPEDGTLKAETMLMAGEKRVTVYVPRTTKYRVSYGDLELDDGASFGNHEYDCTYVAFGDSITNGDEAGHSSMIYVNQLGRMLNARTYNFAIGGMRYLENTIVPGTYPKADIVTVSYGTNDYNNSEDMETMCREVRGFFEKLIREFPEAEKYVFLPIWRESGETVKNKGTLREVVKIIASIAAEYPVTIIDCYDFVPHVLSYYSDGLHPNDLGMQMLGQNLCRAIEKIRSK